MGRQAQFGEKMKRCLLDDLYVAFSNMIRGHEADIYADDVLEAFICRNTNDVVLFCDCADGESFSSRWNIGKIRECGGVAVVVAKVRNYDWVRSVLDKGCD
jgi:hypothetical protein